MCKIRVLRWMILNTGRIGAPPLVVLDLDRYSVPVSFLVV